MVTILVTLPTWVVWVVVAGTHQCKDTLGWGRWWSVQGHTRDKPGLMVWW